MLIRIDVDVGKSLIDGDVGNCGTSYDGELTIRSGSICFGCELPFCDFSYGKVSLAPFRGLPQATGSAGGH